ncbi:sulfurtransferase [Rubinisphaera brasiliensis]|uniref:tRNA uridine(34) hydroxylase n=1 Tax=Rubinisphaera brasiliensis (strain ATCC 49424 / DSM 5305 / JCM 21570 / IAM 15109 / NBRC 103401 / IFAM 1448) TaxID=756272 RepID=F0SP88_RUBBR|nr:sulfurtransferase [Rubinisphaera brasiliensis]ADY62196.1 UPF0176 protein yceA [Rubinisphaera brasiliensis DSM 5305]
MVASPAAPQAANDTLPYVNIAAYLFAKLDRLPERRAELLAFCKERQLKGTILLAPEGINLFMAGLREPIDELLAHLRADPLLAELEAKESFSETQPFSRLLVKLKKEIIAFGIDGIEPGDYTSKKIPPQTLKQWLDEGRPLTLLDTRNDYEVELGTFENALPIGVDSFRDFPDKVRQLPEEMKDRPIVMFCTGGIRCEKAGPFMEREGFREIYQLEGGILKYFEECGGEHYSGDCFVFDHRVALDPQLKETATTQCFACQHPLTPEQQASEKYVAGVSCPFCWTEPDIKRWTPEEREQRIREVATPLPGSSSYTNERPLNVPQKYHDWTLLDFLADYHPHVSREDWASVCEAGLIRYRDRAWQADQLVWEGQRLLRLEPNTIEPDVNPNIKLITWQNQLVVFDKPAPLPVHPCGRFNKNSMTMLLDLAFPETKLRPAHRLDANTTGLIVFTSHRDHSLRIQRQFERGEAEKTYLCRVNGQPTEEKFRCDLPISRDTAEAGARCIDEENGLSASTEFRVLKRLDDGTALVEAKPLTGRTNQIRVHLWHLGFPILNDSVYLPEQKIGEKITHDVSAQPMCLHSWKLRLREPETGEGLNFETPLPAWGTDAAEFSDVPRLEPTK